MSGIENGPAVWNGEERELSIRSRQTCDIYRGEKKVFQREHDRVIYKKESVGMGRGREGFGDDILTACSLISKKATIPTA